MVGKIEAGAVQVEEWSSKRWCAKGRSWHDKKNVNRERERESIEQTAVFSVLQGIVAAGQ